MLTGIYKISNKINSKYYIGSSVNIKRRWRQHRNCLKWNTHPNNHLQNAWNKYGESNFDFIILKETTDEKLLTEEQQYLDNIRNGKQENECYNLSYIAGKIEMTESTRQKISKSSIGKVMSKEARRKNSEAQKGKIVSEETKRKIREALTGKPHPLKPRNKTIYCFIRDVSREEFTGISFDFRVKYNIDKSAISKLIKGKRKICNGWRLSMFPSKVSKQTLP